MAKQSDHSHTKSSNKQRRPKIPQCEVVNEIQIVSNKKENQHNSNIVTTPTTPTSPNDNNKDKTKNCRRRSSIDLSVTTPTTVTTSTIAPAIAKSRSRDKDKSGGTICMCGKLLKRVKGILDRKDKKDGTEEEEEIILPERYYPESVQALCRATKFSEDEIKRMYRGFKAQCPTGYIREETFKEIYSQFFPLGASTSQYAHYVFMAIDRDANGSVSFEEFVLNLSILSRGTMDDKLEWTFQLYDVNNDGFITKEEMTEVITAVYELMGKISEGCKEENQIKAKVESMFKKMDENADNKISLEEFLSSCHKDDGLMNSIAVFQTVI
ncbi:unnamed protein product [Diamesa hyperborea]